MTLRPAAFCDADHTLLAGDMGVAFARHLLRKEWGSRRAGSAFGPRHGQRWRIALFLLHVWLLQALYYPPYRARLVKRSALVRKAYLFYRGYALAALRQEAQAFYRAALAPRIFPGSRELLSRHREAGHEVVLVTTAPEFLARPLAADLGVEHVIACHLETEQGLCTGHVVGPLYGRDKAEAMRDWAEEHDVDMEQSWAYSDHESDAFMLQVVAHPRAVHPRRRMARLAALHRWPALDLREAVKEVAPPERKRRVRRKQA